jgi:YjbE family integral membrane protein
MAEDGVAVSFGATFAAIAKIILIDLVLSGDNAVVIAMASRSLPAEQQRKAIFWGGTVAILVRIIVTAVIAVILDVPLLELGGGVLLLWIAVKLLAGGEEQHAVREGHSLREAIRTIVLADLVMSLDNMLAVGGASHGDLRLLLGGLVVSMAVIMLSSGVIATLMNRFPWLMYAGAGILAWTAGEMILRDRWVDRWLAAGPWLGVLFPAALTGAVVLAGYLMRRRSVSPQTEP